MTTLPIEFQETSFPVEVKSMKIVTKQVIQYYSQPYGLIGVIPKGVECTPADNLPKIENKPRYWAKPWDGMSEKEQSWIGCYGFLISHDEVENIL